MAVEVATLEEVEAWPLMVETLLLLLLLSEVVMEVAEAAAATLARQEEAVAAPSSSSPSDFLAILIEELPSTFRPSFRCCAGQKKIVT